MSERVVITVLVENSVSVPGLKAEHGWACLIEVGGRRVLFDTGQSALLLDNARALGCSLAGLDAIVLSHGHYDHTGGLATVLKLSPAAQVFLHPAALERKFSVRPNGSARFIGMPEDGRQALEHCGAQLKLTLDAREVVESLFVTGEIPRDTDFEDVGGPFFLDAQGEQADPLVDDQSLFFMSADGVVVLLGCAHAGVVNTLLQIEKLTGGQRIRAVIGGMHLLNASPTRLATTLDAFRVRNIPLLVPAHCTGVAAVARLWEGFPERCVAIGVGSRVGFES